MKAGELPVPGRAPLQEGRAGSAGAAVRMRSMRFEKAA